MSLDGLSSDFDGADLDKDVVQKLKEQEEEQKIDKHAKEVLKLMTANREQSQYKKALLATIKEVKQGNNPRKEVEHE